MPSGLKEGSLGRKAEAHGVMVAVRDAIHESDVDMMSLGDLCDQLDHPEEIIREGMKYQKQGEDPWHTGSPWVRLGVQRNAETAEEKEEVDARKKEQTVRITDAGKKAADSLITEVDPAFNTGGKAV